MSKFKISTGFKITDRGFVVCGDILDGEIHTGDNLELSGVKYPISDVSFVDGKDKRGNLISQIGLVLPITESAEIDKLKQIRLKNKIVEVTKINESHKKC